MTGANAQTVETLEEFVEQIAANEMAAKHQGDYWRNQDEDFSAAWHIALACADLARAQDTEVEQFRDLLIYVMRKRFAQFARKQAAIREL